MTVQAQVSEVRFVQEELRRLGILDVNGKRVPVDGLLTPRLVTALVSFQRSRHLPASGVVDARTLSALRCLSRGHFEPAAFGALTKHRRDRAITLTGHNRHTGDVVDDRGLTLECARVVTAVTDHFPTLGPQAFRAREVRRGEFPDAKARGEAIDIVVPHLDGDSPMSGHTVMGWLVELGHGRVRAAQRGTTVRGPWCLSRISFEDWEWLADTDEVRVRPAAPRPMGVVEVEVAAANPDECTPGDCSVRCWL